MMDIRYYILDELYADGYHCGYVDLLNAMEQKHSMPGTVTRALLNEMAEERLVSGCFKAYGGVRLESAGVALYSRLEEDRRNAEANAAKECAAKEAAEAIRLQERREDAATNERHHREQKRLNIWIAIFSFIAGLLVDHIDEFCIWFGSLF